MTDHKHDAQANRQFWSSALPIFAKELAEDPYLSFTTESVKPGPSAQDHLEGSVRPDFILQRDEQFLALELAETVKRSPREIAVERATLANRIRSQLPDGSPVALAVLHDPGLIYSDEPDAEMTSLRSAARAATGGTGFDAVIFVIDNARRALVFQRSGRSLIETDTTVAPAIHLLLDAWAEGKPNESRRTGAQIKKKQFGAKPSTARPDAERYLLVADEWTPSAGGISSFNLEFAHALRARGHDVCIALPDSPSETVRAAAAGSGLKIAVPATTIPGIRGPQGYLSGLRYLDDADFRPTAIIGHGRILGPYAYALQQRYPSASRVHIVHMHPEELERAKGLVGGEPRTRTAAERAALEVELASSADVVAGVGQKLTDWIADHLNGDGLFSARGGQVIRIIPGMRSWDSIQQPAPAQKLFLLTSRADDFESKGIETAIRVIGEVIRQRPDFDGTIGLVIRGVPAQHAAIQEDVDRIAAEYEYKPILREFTTLASDIERDLRTSVALLMPSKTEGFGLSAYEAISAEIPVMVTRDSGLARLLKEVGGSHEWPVEVLPPNDEHAWIQRALKIVDNAESHFLRARELRQSIDSYEFWDRSIGDLEAALDRSRSARESRW